MEKRPQRILVEHNSLRHHIYSHHYVRVTFWLGPNHAVSRAQYQTRQNLGLDRLLHEHDLLH